MLDWPSQGLILNVIENLWQNLKIGVHRWSLSNLIELDPIRKEEWAEISVFRCAKLAEIYLPKTAAVIAANGGSRQY